MNGYLTNISDRIVSWYNKNKRSLPWRNTKSPYKIWISEIILQQTRVKQGQDYYLRFIEKFPDIESLANAPIDEVLRLWQGLGYYSRARNIHKAANQVLTDYSGTFPNTYNNIILLQGIGPYTAAAIASFAFNEAKAVVDGNVNRVISRLFGVKDALDTAIGKKKISQLADQILNVNNPAEHNQAIMEFGALHCTVSSPNCSSCPLNNTCFAFENDSVDILPVKKKKIKQRHRYFYYIYIIYKNSTYIKKRSDKDIWNSLYEFPLIESAKRLSNAQLFEDDKWQKYFHKTHVDIISISEEIKHVLSHQIIHAKFIKVNISEDFEIQDPSFQKIPLNEFDNYAIPRLIEKYLEDHES